MLYPITFPDLLDAAFRGIRQAGETKPAILIRLVEVLALLAARATREGDQDALGRHVEIIERTAARALAEPCDLEDVNRRIQQFRRILAQVRGTGK